LIFWLDNVAHRLGCVLKTVVRRKRVDEMDADGEKNRTIWKPVRGLMWCDSTTPEIKPHFVNRDLNAALNIRNSTSASWSRGQKCSDKWGVG